ncbi:MAG: STAS domain-containing protein [Acidobacteria bacterium]|nr:STAS domain-containing protein [Acidobacteriota bacterium]
METSRPVVVKRMPERLNLRTARQFEREVQPFFTSDRPQVVFDLSQVRRLDAAGVDMLLRCMTQAMKRDGDLKLASLSAHALAILELTRTDRLFEVYETSTDAVRSFTYFLPNALRPFPVIPSPAGNAPRTPGATANGGTQRAA